MHSAAQIKISYQSGRWVANCDRWILKNRQGFTRLEHLLAELATMGVRTSVELDWAGLPAANEFSRAEFTRSARRFAEQFPLEKLEELIGSGFWVLAAAVEICGRLEYSFSLTKENQNDWAESIAKDGNACCVSFVAGRGPVAAPKNYLKEKLERLAPGIKSQIASIQPK